MLWKCCTQYDSKWQTQQWPQDWEKGSFHSSPKERQCQRMFKFSTVQTVMSESLQPHEPQYTGPPCPSPTPRVYPNSSPLSWLCHPTISSSVVPSSSCLQSFPTSGFLQMSQLFIKVAKVLEFQLQHRSFQWTLKIYLLYDGLVGSPCSPRDSQGSSPTPQFKSINSLALSFLYSPALTSIHDPWKNHSLGETTGDDKSDHWHFRNQRTKMD